MSRWLRYFMTLGLVLLAALVFCGPRGALAAPLGAGVKSLQVRADDGTLRLTMETAVGVIGGATMGGGEVRDLRIELRDTTQAELKTLVDGLGALPAPLTSIRSVEGLDGRTIMVLSFSAPVAVLDETVAALSETDSRWELVLADAKMAAASMALAPAQTEAAAPPPSLGGIGFTGTAGRLDVTLFGSRSLVAEVAFDDTDPALYVDLPGVSVEMLRGVLSEQEIVPALVRRLSAAQGPQGDARLVLTLRQPVDLVATDGSIIGGRGQVVMSLVPDAAPDPQRQGRLKKISTDLVEGELHLALPGGGATEANAFTLDNPPRVVVDLLGWRPEQVEKAARAFASEHPVVRQVAVTETRMGSARLVFDMMSETVVVGRRVAGGMTREKDDLVFALRARRLDFSPGDILVADAIERYRRPDVTIRPVELGEPYKTDDVPEPEEGSRYSLMDLLETAFQKDEQYAASRADYRASAEATPQAWADLLPQASFEYQRSHTNSKIHRASGRQFPTGTSEYETSQWNLTLTQPLIQVQSVIKLGQAKLSVEQAKLNLLASEQDLILRVAQSYLNLVAANDYLDLARAERDATGKQFQEARERMSVGLATPAQVHEAQARFVLTEAQEIEARNRVEDARAGLKELVGVRVESVRGLRTDFIAAAPVPSHPEPWVRAAMEQNLALQARSLAVDVAERETTRQSLGYLPKADLVGSMNRNLDNDSIYGQGQQATEKKVMLRVSIPLFQGGRVLSLAREAAAREDSARHTYSLEQRRTERLARQSFLNVETNVNMLDALRSAVVAQESAVAQRLEGFRAGLYSVTTVLDAYRLYFSARRDYLRGRYEYLINRLKLKQAVGTLTRGDLDALQALIG